MSDELRAYLDSLGIEMTCVCIDKGTPPARHKAWDRHFLPFSGSEPNQPSRWTITLVRNKASMVIPEYSMGCGHRTPDGLKPTSPELDNVLYCLSLDADLVRHGQTFEEWCSDLGENTDSRKAEKYFHACRDEWAGLIRLGLDLDKLSEMFQDY